MKKLLLVTIILICNFVSVSSQPCLPQGIIFNTQAQIDSFQINYPNCTEIEGDVTICGSDINNLNGLNILTSIGGDVVLSDNNILSSLSGLDNLVSIVGSLTIGYGVRTGYWGFWEYHGNPLLTDLSGLNELNYIGGSLTIECNDNLVSLSGLENLSYAGGDIIIGHCEAHGYPSSCSYSAGNKYLISLAALYNLDTIIGNLSIADNSSLVNFSGLNMVQINGDLDIGRNNLLMSMEGLESLNAIEGSLIISSNDTLTSLNGLNNLSSIGGSLWIPRPDCLNSYALGNKNLYNLTGLEGLTSIGGDFRIANNDALTSLTGLNNLTFIGEGLVIIGISSLTNLTGLDNITSIGGELHLLNNSALTSLTGLDNVTSIGDYLCISGHDALTSLAGLDNVTSIGSHLYIICNDAFTSLAGLDNVTSIGSYIAIIDNNALTSLAGLDNVTSIGGFLTISFNDALTSLEGLNNVQAGTIESLNIHENYNLSTCHVESVCAYLESPNGAINIYSNAYGCNSQEQVEEACGITSLEDLNKNYSFQWYPNPANQELHIFADGYTINKVVIYSLTGQKLFQTRPENSTIDISHLKPGMYIMEVTVENRKIRQKLLVE